MIGRRFTGIAFGVGAVTLATWMLLVSCDRDKPTKHQQRVGSVVVEVPAPDGNVASDAQAKLAIAQGRLRIAGEGMAPRDTVLLVEDGKMHARVDGVPVGLRTVSLELQSGNGETLWEASTEVTVQKKAAATASLVLSRKGDTAPTVAVSGAPDVAQIGVMLALQAEVSDIHDPTDSLMVRWDFDNDGSYETGWTYEKTTSFQAESIGNQRIALEARDRTGNSASVTQLVRLVELHARTGPNAGADSLVAPMDGSSVVLNGSSSSGVDDRSIVYHWGQIQDYPGAVSLSVRATFSDNDAATAGEVSFQPLAGPGIYVFALTVEDTEFGLVSQPDTLFVLVRSLPPVASVGNVPAEVEVGQSIVLTGLGSDPDDEELTYRWRGEHTELLSDTTAAMPTFRATEGGEYEYSFVAVDGDPQESEPVEVVIAVRMPGPVASVLAAPTAGAAPLTVTFANNSTYADRYSWSFGDGTSSTEATPQAHVYGAQGTYQVTLRAYGLDDRADSAQVQIVVSDRDRPDLLVESIRVLDTSDREVQQLDEGMRVSVGIGIGNGGTERAQSFRVRVELMGLEAAQALSEPLELGAGENLEWSVDWQVLPGASTLRVTIVPPEEGVAEANTNNNEYEQSLVGNARPVAAAGPDVSGTVGVLVQLDGSGSSDPEGSGLSYVWEQTSGPNSVLSGHSIAAPSFVPAEEGTYNFQLVVSDGRLESDVDEVAVSARLAGATNAPPVADAGSDQQVQAGSSVRLDGSGSTDADGDALTYRWTAPSGISLSSSGAESPTFTVGSSGTYRFTLIVNDGGLDSAPDEVVITVVADVTPGETITVDLPNGAAMDFVWIEPGTFVMGSPDLESGRDSNEGPQHEVTISRGFWLAKYEITQGQWEAAMGTTPWIGKSQAEADPQHPAVYISWNDVQGFMRQLNEAAGEEAYRLPTEAEWEYACRAGTSTRWSFGDDEDSQIDSYAWHVDNAWIDHAQPVGTKLPNPWALHDMHGNVFEWCQDWYAPYSSSSQVDPTGPASGLYRIVRGGPFDYGIIQQRSAYRNCCNFTESSREYNIGVRLLRMAEPLAINRPPVADAGSDQQVQAGSSVRLDGSGSTDADGDALTYRWTAPSGISLSSSGAESPTFTATTAGTFPITLVVNDGEVNSAPDEVVITVEELPVETLAVTTPTGTTHEMVHVPAAPFEMGSTSSYSDEQPVHTVELDGYFIDKYEVTNGQYVAFVTRGGGQPSEYANDSSYNASQQPVVGVSWFDAEAYCGWAGLRLPTEAEWEKAARGTDGRTYPWGNEAPTCDRAVMDDGGLGCGTGVTWPVGSKPDGVSPYGAHDMAGNAWEWVSDWYDSYPSGTVSNPTGPSSGSDRVFRGGSWGDSHPPLLSSSRRDRRPPTTRTFSFRCAQDE